MGDFGCGCCFFKSCCFCLVRLVVLFFCVETVFELFGGFKVIIFTLLFLG